MKKKYSKPEAVLMQVAALAPAMLSISISDGGSANEEFGGSDALANQKGWDAEDWNAVSYDTAD
ncbi:MAG: hypothetical protein J1F06_06630 [Prevotellaceae bacterium]|nr:hypothetical protein [Prevotellaceae bacterium]